MTLKELEVVTEELFIENCGDPTERHSSDLLVSTVPGYQRFWRLFVCPYRETIEGNWISAGLPRSHEAVCIYNYSLMRSFLRLYRFWGQARLNKELINDTSSQHFEDFFIRLSIIHDQLSQFISATYCAFQLGEQGKGVGILEWKDKYQKPSGKWLMSEGQKDLILQAIQDKDNDGNYRHHIVHGPKWPGADDRVPKTQLVPTMMYWSDLREAETGNEWIANSVDRFKLISKRKDGIAELLESVWQTLADMILREHGDKEVINADCLAPEIRTRKIPTHLGEADANSSTDFRRLRIIDRNDDA